LNSPAPITLTTDLGLKDYYVASVKASIHRQLPGALIFDISHHVSPFNSEEAAWQIRNAFPDFPEGTVHIIGVNPELTAETPHLVVKSEGQYFVGADNGVFSLILDKIPDTVVELNMLLEVDRITFPSRDVFAKAACFLARGGAPEVLGKRVEGIRQATDVRPQITHDSIKGRVVYSDNYGNAHINITESIFKEVGRGRAFRILMRSSKFGISKISPNYHTAKQGDAVAVFSHNGHLEIAINKGAPGNGGGANRLLGLEPGASIIIEFRD
jgi:S-adenosyl-L-methionine hydrolase (adenosine-forming)